MPDSIRLQTYAQIWTLLEAHAPFAEKVLTGNRIKLTGDGAQRASIHRAPADYPQAALSAGRLLASSAFAETLTFAGESSTFVADGGVWLVRRSYEYALTLKSGWLRLSDLDPAEEAAHIALLKGGPRLGIAEVQQWGPLSSEQEQTDTAEGGKMRQLTTRILIPITFLQNGKTLVT